MRQSCPLRFTFALLVALPSLGAAQTSHAHLGGRFTYDATNEMTGLGVQLSAPIGARLELYPSADFMFPDVGSRWVGNIDLKYRFPAAERPLWFYVGAGVGFDRRSFRDVHDTEAGLNLFTGLEPLRGAVHPFMEVRLTAADETRVGLAVGLNITLNGNR